ncbi:MAG: hypothetical protein IKS31_10135 [Clostridia bacterium]|nr:hypothetical protein [Clostridia bacterium]
MSRKAIRVLAVLAFSLYAAALTVSVLLITVFRISVLQQFGFDHHTLPDMVWKVPIPFVSLSLLLLEFVISLVLMILAFRLRTDRSSRVAVIVLAILLGILVLLSYPASTLQSISIARSMGPEGVIVHNAMSSAVSTTGSVLIGPANILMLLAMGGFCNRAGRLCKAELPESDNPPQGGNPE